MRRALASLARFAPLVAALAAVAAAPVSSAADVEDPAADLRVTELENGLTLLTLEDPTTPVVSFQIWVEVGSADEARYTGLAHLFEHMMFRGSTNLPPEAHARFIESRGGRVNAFTSRDVTVYFEEVTAEDLPLVIGLEAERLENLDLSEETLKSEREVVLEERRMRTEDDPQGRAFEALLALTFQAHPYRHPTIGWRSDVEAVDLEACREFFRSFYAPNNMVVAVAGDFETERVRELVRRHLGALEPAKSVPRIPTAEPEQRGERRAVVHDEVRGPLLAAAWHAPPTGHEDAEALDVAGEILSAGRSSRLYRRLVYEEQAALSASGGYWELHDAGLFYAMAAVRPDAQVDRAETFLMEEIARLRREPVTADELEKAKRKLEVRLLDGLETSHDLAMRVGREWTAFGRVRPLSERLEAIRAVTAEDVQRVARRYLRDAKRSVVRVVPPPAEEDEAAGADGSGGGS